MNELHARKSQLFFFQDQEIVGKFSITAEEILNFLSKEKSWNFLLVMTVEGKNRRVSESGFSAREFWLLFV